MKHRTQVTIGIVAGLVALAACVATPRQAHGAITASCASHITVNGIQRWASWNAIAALPDGNYAVAGIISGTADLPPTLVTANGSLDAVVAKINATTCVPIWVRTVSGTGQAWGFGVATDGAGSVYATGQFSGEAKIGPVTLTNRGLNDGWAAKWDGDGNPLAAWSLGGAASDTAYAITVRDGVVYVGGQIGGGDWNAGGGVIPGGYGRGSTAFVARYTSGAGNFIGEQHWDGSQNDVVWSLNTTANGDVIAAGTFGSTAGHGATIPFTGEALGGTASLTSLGEQDWWIARLSADLTDTQWVRRFGGPSSDNLGGVALDEDGNLYVTGSFRGDATGVDTQSCLDQGCPEVMSLTPLGQRRWSHSWGMGNAAYLGDTPKAVTVSGNRVWIGGAIINPLDFGTGPLTAPQERDVFLVEFTLDGTTVNAVRYPSAFGDQAYALAPAPGGVVAVGQYFDSIDFGCPGCTFRRQAGTVGEGWIARFTDGSVPPTVVPVSTSTPENTVASTPTRTNTEIPTVPPRTPTQTNTCRVLATPTLTPTALYVPCE